MRPTKLLPLVLLLGAARAYAQEPTRTGPGLLPSPAVMDPTPPPYRLGLLPLHAPPGDWPDIRFAAPAPAWWATWPPSWIPVSWLAEWVPPEAPALAAADSVSPAPDRRADGFVLDIELPELVAQSTEIELRVEGRGELGGAWNRYRPCEPALRLNCNPDLFPQLRPDVRFGVQVGGTITDRIHLDVDYDQRREFDAANNINVYYQGLSGEVLQRVEMGDVSIDLPPSRYLTQGIPAGNFGFKAAANFGAVDVEAVWAQQKGDIASREFRLGGGGQAGLVQDQELVIDDADYVTGQFFFVLDPSRLAGAPHVDVLTLGPGAAPPAVRPRGGTLVVYRDEGAALARYQDQAQAGKFLADAVAEGGELRHSGLFTLLEPGQDYYVHSSGLWIALRAPLRDDESLAIGYVTESGDTVGDPAPELTPVGQKPELRLVRGPIAIHQPGQPTWSWEMHQVYRLDSSAEVEASSLDLVVSLGHVAGGATFKQHEARQIPLLRLFGLDDDAPADRVDIANLFRPGSEREGVGGAALRGTFVVFPTLEPFGRPPPVPIEELTAAGSAAVLGTDANATIYDETDPVLRTSASRFRLNFRYRVRLEGLPSSFNLGAFGIRQGSERITVDDRLLARGTDYVIDYDLGLITLLDPRAVLGGNPDAEIRATWEQKALFDIAPTTVFGLNTRTRLGEYGELNVVGLYQSEQSVVRRPQLGMAPAAVMLGGASGRVAFQADWLRGALGAIPGLRVDSVARLDVTGELALSVPNPNRQGATYLDDFEATDEIPLSLDAWDWRLGSAPQHGDGLDMLDWPPRIENATRLVWQDRYLQDGREVGFLTPQEIDQQIALAGTQLGERVLYMTMGEEGTSQAPQWRSITTVVSTTGRDLSRSEYLEFYAAPNNIAFLGAYLVIDVGTVGEDAFYYDEEGNLTGIASNGRAWGQGVLDEEARLALREVWGLNADAEGLWDQTCEADRLNPLPLGDPRANCTVLNGRPDTEDLNGNGVLDPFDGPLHRYVVPLDASSPFVVRNRDATGTQFRLYRIPLRGGSGIEVGGASDASWRFVKHIRVTLVKPETTRGTLAVARFRIAGSRWTKRDLHGVVAGLTGDVPGSGALSTSLRVGPVSRLTDGTVYSSPPGVEDELQDPKSAVGATGVEFNEKSLRLRWEELPSDERAEVYFRYPQQPRSFLEYRELRLWAVAREGDWGGGGDHRLLVKLGTDARNYYLYQTPLNPATPGSAVVPADWLPERVIDFERWFALKAEAERQLIERGGGGGPIVVWSADSSYAVVMEDRARAPNLSAVRELSFAVYNGGPGGTTGEVWLNDLRLGRGSTDPGFAGRVNLDLNAGGFLAAGVSFGGRGGRFRQLEDAATYQSTDELVVNTAAELGRFAPEHWGVSMPLSVSYLRTGLDPLFLQGTDVRAERLDALRGIGLSRRRVGLGLRKTTPSTNPIVSALVDGTALRIGYTSVEDGTVTTASRLNGIDGGISFDRRVGVVDFGIVPGFLEAALRWIAPRRIEQSAFFDRLTGARLRLTPERVGLSTSYTSQQSRVWRYDSPLAGPADDDVVPIESPRRQMENTARLTLRPLASVTGQIGLITGRDLLEPDRATPLATERQALREARLQLAGVPLGWERDRVVSTDLAYRPVIADWVRPSIAWNSRFGQRRDPAHLEVVETADGETALLQRTFHADRRLSRGLIFDPASLARATFDVPPGGDPGGAGRIAAALVRALSPIKPFDLTWTDEAGSRFDRRMAEPGLGYQLGFGGLDRFRVVDGDTAANAMRRDGFRARSGIRVGSTASIDLGYGRTEARLLDLRSGRRDQLERSWPDVQLSWQEIPMPATLDNVLDRWSVSTGYVRTERVTTLGGDVARVRSQDEATIPLELRLGFNGGLGFSYIGTLTLGDGVDPTGRIAHDALSHGVDLSGRVRAPGPLQGRFPEPLRLSLAYDYQAQQQCRQAGKLGPGAPCVPFIDYLNRRVNVSVSTLVSQLDLGLRISYIDRRNFVGTQAGSSQFQLGLFGQFNLQAATF